MTETLADSERRVLALADGDEASFVQSAYRLVLGRAADDRGTAFYLSRLAAGATRRELVRELASSDEGRAFLELNPEVAVAVDRWSTNRATAIDLRRLLELPDPAFIAELGTRVLQRRMDVDEAGIMLARIRGGTPRYRILAECAEASGKSSFPDLAGLDDLLAQVRSGLYPVARSVTDLLQFKDEAFVDCAYKTLFGRAPDFDGLANYVHRLREGWSPLGVLAGMCGSPEANGATGRVAGLAEALRRHRRANAIPMGWLMGLARHDDSDAPAVRRRRILEQLAMRNSALEAQLRTTRGAGGGDDGEASAPVGKSVAAARRRATALAEDQIAARVDAMFEIQRDNFDRELTAIRATVARLLDERRHPGQRRRSVSSRALSLRRRLRWP